MVLLSGIFSDTPINTQEIPQKLLDIQDKQRSNPLPWKGQFSPQLIETLINKYADNNSIIFDSFIGSGTVLYEAARFGIEAHGTEINPAALTLASIYKFTNISQRQREIYTNNFLEQLRTEIPDDTMPLFQSINLQKDLAPEKNDIISACIKYCVYLRDIPTDSLTPEDKDFMKTMEQIDAWYEAEMNKAKLKGKIESVSTGIKAKFGAEVLTPQLVSQLSKLNEQQLDDFLVGMFNWQQLCEMQEWLSPFV